MPAAVERQMFQIKRHDLRLRQAHERYADSE